MRPRAGRHEPGDRLELDITGVDAPVENRAVFEIERLVGGGFAGQVYRARLRTLEPRHGETITGLETGNVYALKILVPPGRFSAWFRNLLYRIGFQAPFLPQHCRSAARAGVLWQKMIRHAARERFGAASTVVDTHATFFDPALRSFGDVNEWVEGRTWRLEIDDSLCARRRALRAGEDAVRAHPAAEYLAKRHAMRRFVDLLDEMGAGEFCRQYEWATWKSQPNMLKRVANGEDPFAGLTAIDFRAGLVLLPFLPMSIGDVRLIFRGLARGRLVQFDRGDMRRFDRFVERHPNVVRGRERLLEELHTAERDYREALPDLTWHGPRRVWSRRLRRATRAAYIESWIHRGLITESRARLLRRSRAAYLLYFVTGAVPWLGKMVRRLWGDPDYARHFGSILSRPRYAGLWMRTARADVLLRWHRNGRVGDRHAERLLRQPLLFWLERLTLGLLPFPGLHRWISEPAYAWGRIRDGVMFIVWFYRDNAFRERWLHAEIEAGREEGMLTPAEADTIGARVKEPYIQRYLKCLAVHFCTLPVTQIVALITAAILGGRHYAGTGDALKSGGIGVAILVAFQLSPISPGSLTRGLYVLYVMIRERNVRDYAVAAPVSFLHYIGYLAFPIQMVAKYPALSRFMAGRWATHFVRRVPVFGERGALLEHKIFDAFFNIPVSLRAGLRRRRVRRAARRAAVGR